MPDISLLTVPSRIICPKCGFELHQLGPSDLKARTTQFRHSFTNLCSLSEHVFTIPTPTITASVSSHTVPE